MASSPYTYKFNRQAAFGTEPGVMAEIHRDGCNIGVWKGGATAIRESRYVGALDLSVLGKGMAWKYGYYRLLASIWPVEPSSQTSINKNLQHLNRQLQSSGFPKGNEKSDSERRQFASSVVDIALHFAQAMASDRAGFSLLLFRPRAFGYWHTDGELARGIYTVKIDDDSGDLTEDGCTLWRPDRTLPKKKPRDSVHWGSFEGANPRNAERLEPDDVAAFRCRQMGDALVHATPQYPGLRLTVAMSLPESAKISINKVISDFSPR